jgi:integrase
MTSREAQSFLRAARSASFTRVAFEATGPDGTSVKITGRTTNSRTERTTGIRYCTMTKIRLRFVQSFAVRGNPYYYFRKPGCARVKLPGLPGSEAFMAAYQAALTASSPPTDIGAQRNAPGTVAALVALYANSSQFKHEIAAETRRTMWAILQRFRDEHGSKRVAMLRREHVLALLNGRPPFAKRNWLRALRPLLDFAVSINMITGNPTKDIKAKVPRKGEGFRAWGEDQIEAFRHCHALGTRARLALELLLNTAQRRGDVVRMGPQHIRSGLLHLRQRKTGELLQLPIFLELQAAIDAIPGGHLTFLVTASGKPFSDAGFGNWFREVCNEAGLHGYSAHGLRKAACRRLAEAGCTAHEIAAWSGHRTLSEVAHYTRAADQVALARAARTKLATQLSKSVGPAVKTRKKANKNNG